MHLDPSADLQAYRLDPTPTDATVWSDLEQEFFASAPPDEPEPPAEPSCFDDLREVPAPRRRSDTLRTLGRVVSEIRRLVAATAARGPRRTIAIVVGAIALLISLGLSAVVLAAR